jgi:hypothetical protein
LPRGSTRLRLCVCGVVVVASRCTHTA